ncbi:hypothetical protein [Nereida sp.]|uniref:hypothetical protein n=1 Tax=Nereida sp. TaxID=2736090 RepID=UPI003F69D58B
MSTSSKSANEASMLLQKAARGAGFGVAQARDFGIAAALHLYASRSEGDLIDALTHSVGPITTLPAMMDDLLDPTSDGCGVFTGLALSYFQTATARPAIGRIVMSYGLNAHLNTLAAKTYVPASDASRLAGAGAGLTDND